MKILALEFSTEHRSVALGILAEGRLNILRSDSEIAASATALVLIDRLLKQTGVAPSEIGRIVLGLGPGSYAGIRSAIALAQGWQLARNVQLLGISSIDVLAVEAQKAGVRGEISLVVDAQRQEFYRAMFFIDAEACRPIGNLEIVSSSALDPSSRLMGPAAPKLPGSTVLFPSAKTLLEIAAARSDSVPGERLEPIYLRETSFVKAPTARFG